jgi:hypothetical protein
MHEPASGSCRELNKTSPHRCCINLASTPWSPKWSLPFKFTDNKIIYVSNLSFLCYVPYQPYISALITQCWWRLQITTLLIVQFDSSSGLTNPSRSVFVLQSDRPMFEPIQKKSKIMFICFTYKWDFNPNFKYYFVVHIILRCCICFQILELCHIF